MIWNKNELIDQGNLSIYKNYRRHLATIPSPNIAYDMYFTSSK